MSGIVGQNLGRASGLIKSGGVGADSVTSASIADDAIDSEHYTNASIDNAHLADDAVGTDEIADNAVTLAKMAGGTDGQIITYDASGNPSAVGPGSDGEVLTSTGAGSPPAFEAAASSDFVKLHSSTTTSTASEVQVTGCFSATYKVYKIYIQELYSDTDDDYPQIQLLESTTAITDNYVSKLHGTYKNTTTGGTAEHGGHTNTTGWYLINTWRVDDADYIRQFPAEVTIYNPYTTSSYTYAQWQIGGIAGDDYIITESGMGYYDDETNQPDGFEVHMNTGNIEHLQLDVYGLKT